MIYEAIDRWNSPDSYLEHHGVKGMKWGVRKQQKYENKAAKYQKRANSGSIVGGHLLRKYNEDMAAGYRVKAMDQAAANNETSLKRKLQQKYGVEHQARSHEEVAKVFEARAKRAKTGLGRRLNTAGAYNGREMAKYKNRRAKESTSTIDRLTTNSIAATWNVPAKTLIRNKQTTHGKQILKAYFATAAYVTAITALESNRYQRY